MQRKLGNATRLMMRSNHVTQPGHWNYLVRIKRSNWKVIGWVSHYNFTLNSLESIEFLILVSNNDRQDNECLLIF